MEILQKYEEILNELVQARNFLVTDDKKSALEILVGVQKELHNFHGRDFVYIRLLTAYGSAYKCATMNSVDVQGSADFKDLQKHLGLCVEIIKPDNEKKEAEEPDDFTATKPY